MVKLSRAIISVLTVLSVSMLLYIKFVLHSNVMIAHEAAVAPPHAATLGRAAFLGFGGLSAFRRADSGRDDSPKIAYFFAGSARSFPCPKVHWTIKSHLIDALGGSPHVFVRISLVDNSNSRTGSGKYVEANYGHNEVNETLKILNPIEVQHVSLATEEAEMAANYPGNRHTAFRVNDRRRYSMYYNRCMAYKMILKYEKEHNMRFDWVVMARLDAQWIEPILPIKYYANDRTWLTESGWVPLNDQFMLVPRQFSDYLFDLDTKVQAGVYCLGGPDVEKWKCNATALPEHNYSDDLAKVTLDACCGENERRDFEFGYSEKINKRHFEFGKIPVSLGSFQVFLVRKRLDLPEEMSCFPECWRTSLMINTAFLRSNHQLYPYLVSPARWPDVHWGAMSVRNHMACEMLNNVRFPWNPISAANWHAQLNTNKNNSSELSPSKTGIDFSSVSAASLRALAVGGIGGGDASTKVNNPAMIDYSKSLVRQKSLVHPSIFLDRKDLEAYRIHPIGDRSGCLTWDYRHLKSDGKSSPQLMWKDCIDHARHLELFRLAHDNSQLFFMYLMRSEEPVSRASASSPSSENIVDIYDQQRRRENVFEGHARYNTTRVINYGREGNIKKKWQCLTATGMSPGTLMDMRDCSDNPKEPSQLFLTVVSSGLGAHSRSSVGPLRLANAPELCVALVNGGSVSKYPPVLSLVACRSMDSYLQYYFEFEYIVW